jgi:hypothetical protein
MDSLELSLEKWRKKSLVWKTGERKRTKYYVLIIDEFLNRINHALIKLRFACDWN